MLNRLCCWKSPVFPL